mmetsp:Transcript_31704/g.100734  ORF Transcript_31704/g.100734 Transcript_31704/m.100734 type:complete len:99 (-) Transcript_31704:1842-2138(-)
MSGFWTPHYSPGPDGPRLFYFNMKLRKSLWADDPQAQGLAIVGDARIDEGAATAAPSAVAPAAAAADSSTAPATITAREQFEAARAAVTFVLPHALQL